MLIWLNKVEYYKKSGKLWIKKKIKTFESIYKNGKSLKFGNIEFQKLKFHQHWLQRCWKVRPLSLFLPKMSAYRKDFDETKYLPFFDKRWWLIRKFEIIMKRKIIMKFEKNLKISSKKQIDSEPVYNEKYVKAKMKS